MATIVTGYRLPTWLSLLLPGGKDSQDIARKSYYKAWKEGVLAVFARDEYWGSLTDFLSHTVDVDLAAIRDRVDADREHLAAAVTASGVQAGDAAKYFALLAKTVVGDTRYQRIVRDGDPYHHETAQGQDLFALTTRGELISKLAKMASLFKNAEPVLVREVKAWQTKTVNAVWRRLEDDPDQRKRIFTRCDHALQHLRNYQQKGWPMEDGMRRVTLNELFDLVPSAETLVATTPLVHQGAEEGCHDCVAEHAASSAQQHSLARRRPQSRFFPEARSSAW